MVSTMMHFSWITDIFWPVLLCQLSLREFNKLSYINHIYQLHAQFATVWHFFRVGKLLPPPAVNKVSFCWIMNPCQTQMRLLSLSVKYSCSFLHKNALKQIKMHYCCCIVTSPHLIHLPVCRIYEQFHIVEEQVHQVGIKWKNAF